MSKSENRAKLYLSHKDHKKESEKTRPIGTANSSNTRAFANSVSDLLEAIANSEEMKYEVISSEDMLYNTKTCNQKIRKHQAEMLTAKNRKKTCWSCRVWKVKCRGCKPANGDDGDNVNKNNDSTNIYADNDDGENTDTDTIKDIPPLPVDLRNSQEYEQS